MWLNRVAVLDLVGSVSYDPDESAEKIFKYKIISAEVRALEIFDSRLNAIGQKHNRIDFQIPGIRQNQYTRFVRKLSESIQRQANTIKR